MKIALCIPTYGDTKARFTLSLVDLVERLIQQDINFNGELVKPQVIRCMCIGESRLDRARQELAGAALAENPDYLLWLDSDQTFPSDTFYRLALHDLPVVGCNYPRRNSTAGVAGMIVNGLIVPIEPKLGGVEPVDILGFGVMLTKAEVFQRLSAPWFALDPLGEDGYFCRAAKAAGIQPMLDHALSMEIGHIGEVVHRFSKPPAP